MYFTYNMGLTYRNLWIVFVAAPMWNTKLTQRVTVYETSEYKLFNWMYSPHSPTYAFIYFRLFVFSEYRRLKWCCCSLPQLHQLKSIHSTILGIERMRKTILRYLMLSFIRLLKMFANTQYALLIANNLKAENRPFSQYLRDSLFTVRLAGIFFSILLPELHKSSVQPSKKVAAPTKPHTHIFIVFVCFHRNDQVDYIKLVFT